jgi:hypothetical protein
MQVLRTEWENLPAGKWKQLKELAGDLGTQFESEGVREVLEDAFDLLLDSAEIDAHTRRHGDRIIEVLKPPEENSAD